MMEILTREFKKRWKENELPVDIHTQWHRHLNDYQLKFPRDVGLFPLNQRPGEGRWPVDGWDHFTKTVDRYRTGYNSYTNVYSRPMIAGDVYDTFYIDIDAEVTWDADDDDEEILAQFKGVIGDAYFDVQKIVYYLDGEYDAEPRIYYTGGRGFSVYFDFPPRNVQFGAVAAVGERILEEADVNSDIIDESVYESNRLSRLPYTLNWNNYNKRGMDPLMSFPVDPDWSKEELLDEIMEPKRFLDVRRKPSEEIASEINTIDDISDFEKRTIEVETDADPEESLWKVKYLLQKAEYIRDGRNRLLWAIMVPALIESGITDTENIHRYCREFIERSGKEYVGTTYEQEVDRWIDRTVEGPRRKDGKYRSWNFETFLQKHDELLKYFVEE